MRRTVIAVCAVVLALVGAAPGHAEKRVALVVGNDLYDNLPADQQLRRAANDARAVGDALDRLGFEVLRGENLGRQALVEKLDELTRRLSPGDTAFFFFAGHGVSIRGGNYILPTDVPNVQPGQETLLARTSLGETDIVSDLQGGGRRVAVVVLDACRNNPFKRPDTQAIGGERGCVRSDPVPGVFSIYSAGLGQTALDQLGEADNNPNSVFTRVLVPALRRPELDLGGLAIEVSEEVARLAGTVGHVQRPAYYDASSVPLQLTIPEGLTSEQIVARLAEVDFLAGNIREIPKEGTLLAETYNFPRGTTREQAIQRMQNAHRRAVQEIWERRSTELPFASPEQLVTLASIVEKETGRPDQRSRVAAVFVNRLRQRLKLQSDQTVIYGLVGGKGALGRPIMRSEIEQPTPYNTYAIEGLPPGPIANPGRASLEAAANPARTKEVYFVADGTGAHAFAENLQRHQQNVALARAEELRKSPATAPAPPSSGSDTSAAPTNPNTAVTAAAQRVALYEEDPADQYGKRFVGSATWRTQMVSVGPGSPPDLAVRADIEIPERRMTLSLVIRRDLKQVLSHIIEITFNLPADFPFGGIQNVPGVLMRPAEQTLGSPLGGASAEVTPGYFLIGLSAVETDMQRNIQLLKERSWLDISIIYEDGRLALLSIEKGTPGELAIEEAFKAWGQTSADLAKPPATTASVDQNKPFQDRVGAAPTPVQVVPREEQAVPLPTGPAPGPRATAPQPFAQSAAPLISPPPPFANEPKKVKTLTVRRDADCAAMAARTPAAKAGGGAFVVQVSAQKTEDEARAAYQVLQQKYPCVLGGRDPIIRRAELGQSGTWYRVHVGAFATSEQATTFCNSLKDAGGQCIVQKNASAGGTGHGTAVPSLLPPGTSSGVLAPPNPLLVVPRGAQPVALPPGGDYVVQVSAQKTEDEARAAYQTLQQKYPSVLGSREVNIRPANLGIFGVYYRAQVGPFATADQANAFCGDLKAAGGQCIVQENASAGSTGHGTAVPSLMPPGGSAKELPPVDILYVASGPCNRNENNKLNCRIGKDVNRGVDDRYGWSIGFRTNQKTVHFVEEIEVSAPTTWPEPRPGFTVSNDKRSARFEREVDGSQGYLSHIWVLLSDDPDGSIKIKVTIENKLVRNFELLVKSP